MTLPHTHRASSGAWSVAESVCQEAEPAPTSTCWSYWSLNTAHCPHNSPVRPQALFWGHRSAAACPRKAGGNKSKVRAGRVPGSHPVSQPLGSEVPTPQYAGLAWHTSRSLPSLVPPSHCRGQVPFPAPIIHNRELTDKSSHFLSTYYVPGMQNLST